jgi:hypothetical protein
MLLLPCSVNKNNDQFLKTVARLRIINMVTYAGHFPDEAEGSVEDAEPDEEEGSVEDTDPAEVDQTAGD